MPHPGRLSLGEAFITTTLLSIYLSARGTALAIAAAQTSPSLCTSAAASLRARTPRLQAMRAMPTFTVTSIA